MSNLFSIPMLISFLFEFLKKIVSELKKYQDSKNLVMKRKDSLKEWLRNQQLSMIWLKALHLQYMVIMMSKKEFLHNFLVALSKSLVKSAEDAFDQI